jgi:16S rRNA (uracil1498-N3)-methyltransferase
MSARQNKEPEGQDLTEPGGKIRLFVEGALSEGARIAPSPQQTHYLLHVMRARVGDRLRFFNGRDGEWAARLTEAGRRDCVLVCERQTERQRGASDLWLVFAPIKKTPADYVAQKATELGVSAVQPVLTRRTIAHRVNAERLRANAIEAAEQSGRLTVPDIHPPLPLDKLLEAWPAERAILFCDESGGEPIARALADAPDGPWAVLTGPEGGFDPAERDWIRQQPNTLAVTLGERILRADTAALAALAIWQAVKSR